MLIPETAREVHPRHRAGYGRNPIPRPMGAGMELAGRRRDGTTFPAEISLSSIQTADGVVVSAAVRDVTERKEIEKELRDKNAELEKVSRAKDIFLASMSHELRTPLNAIIGFTGTLLMELAGPLTDDQVRQLTTVENSAKHLLAIINDLLDLAKIESSAVELALEQIDLVELVRSVTMSLAPLAVEKTLEFTVDLPDEPVLVDSDARALGQILINLLSNAIKFTDSGEVRVALENDEVTRECRIVVSDTGPGVSGENLHRIFEAFERGNARASGREGTGLGLYISHKLAELLGARVTVDTVFGEGSSFAVVLNPAA
jgi:protein-histidine pros-kinase